MNVVEPDMQKDTTFTPTSLMPKSFYPKKCVSYEKIKFSTKLRKMPKRHESAKKAKNYHKVAKCAKKCHLKA